jgi:hypothetical protein
MRNIESKSCRNEESNFEVRKLPINTKIREGSPIFNNIFLLIAFLNKAILETLLIMCNMTVMPSTEWKSTKKPAIGTKNTEEPNPPTVPRISAIKVRIRKIISRDVSIQILLQRSTKKPPDLNKRLHLNHHDL